MAVASAQVMLGKYVAINSAVVIGHRLRLGGASTVVVLHIHMHAHPRSVQVPLHSRTAVAAHQTSA